mmetsp:Transcript_20730/g.36215  ORF Transcript_20730/g.36215 Transcript_20730/m.36215 type:complete len:81 (+) Transcript_20730:4600-4842(+)
MTFRPFQVVLSMYRRKQANALLVSNQAFFLSLLLTSPTSRPIVSPTRGTHRQITQQLQLTSIDCAQITLRRNQQQSNQQQ